MTTESSAFRRAATALTVAGALPFIGLVVGMAVLPPPTNLTASFWLMVYATVILSFLGGIRWGLAIAGSAANASTLGLSVLPALAGWVIVPYAILVQQAPGAEWFAVYALLFAVQACWDRSSDDVPPWFKPVRLTVSGIVIASLLAAWAIRQFLS